MKVANTKLAVVATVMAAIAGGASLGVEQLKSFLVQHGRLLAEGPAAAFVAYILMKMLQIMKNMKHNMKWIADKTTYIEQRIDAAAARSGDICRHMQQVFLDFDEGKKVGKGVAMRWWWVERRLRELYEDFSNSKAMEKCSYEVVKKTWSMMQLECRMRALRDVVSQKHFGVPLGDDEDNMEWALKNMMKAGKYCYFWRPMKVSELEQHEVQSCFEELLISQISERVKEVQHFLEDADLKKYEGLEFEGIAGGSSSN